jgi:hypothetical protein
MRKQEKKLQCVGWRGGLKLHIACQNRNYFKAKWKLRCLVDIITEGLTC